MLSLRSLFLSARLFLLAGLIAAYATTSSVRADDPPAPPPAKAKGKPDTHPFPKGPSEEKYAKMLGDTFKKRYTDHFVVFYDAEEAVVKDFIQRIERTYDSVSRFAVKMDIKLQFPKEKLPILFCGTYEGFIERFKMLTGGQTPPEAAAGLYLNRPINASIFYDMSQNKYMKEAANKAKAAREAIKSAKDANSKRAKMKEAQFYDSSSMVYQQDQNRSVVQHEVGHQLMYNLGVHNAKNPWANPQWFVEGMATIFEPPPGKNGAGFNVVNQRRLGNIHTKMEKLSDEELRKFIASPTPDHSMMSEEGYSESWAICYFLVKRKTKQLPAYMELINSRPKGEHPTPEQQLADFEKIFGKVNESFMKDMKSFVAKLPLQSASPDVKKEIAKKRKH